MRRILIGLTAGLLAACSDTPEPAALQPLPPVEPVALDSLTIEVSADENRAVSFTNKRSAYFYTQTHANDHEEHAWFAGLNIAQRRVFSGFEFIDETGQVVTSDYLSAEVGPGFLRRERSDGLTETIRLLDHLDRLIIELSGGDRPPSYILQPTGDGVRFVRGEGRLAIYTPQEGDDLIGVSIDGRGRYFVSVDEEDALAFIAPRLPSTGNLLLAERNARLTSLLTGSRYVATSDGRLTKALRWLMITTDQLVTQQQGDGIYAGLPWFNEYWGRDTFIAMPGALLVTGEFETARDVLTSFAAFQDLDPDSRYYGRVPNRARPDDLNYQTTDGTPRFVIALADYVRYSGDNSIIEELWPNVVASIEGSLANWTDEAGYLTHEDNETWMDARRQPDLAAYSPRDTRANDIQALWYGQLQAGIYFARQQQDIDAARRWEAIAARLAGNFERDFTSNDHTYLADRLDADDVADFSLRPNQFFALDMIADDGRAARAVRTGWENLVFPWGVASLAPGEENFHPYHLAWEHYHKDSAYHNGTIWLWLNGIAMQRMIEFGQVEPAWELFSTMNDQVLDEGVVGGLAENMDAYPHGGEDWPRLTGTYLQAWSNTEQLRVWYQYFLGVRPDMINAAITLAPRLPEELDDVRFSARAGDGMVEGYYSRIEGGRRYSWQFDGVEGRARIEFPGFAAIDVQVAPGSRIELDFVGDQLTLRSQPGPDAPVRQEQYDAQPDLNARFDRYDTLFEGLRFASPRPLSEHAVMQTE